MIVYDFSLPARFFLGRQIRSFKRIFSLEKRKRSQGEIEREIYDGQPSQPRVDSRKCIASASGEATGGNRQSGGPAQTKLVEITRLQARQPPRSESQTRSQTR
jgi:hypothetical protein